MRWQVSCSAALFCRCWPLDRRRTAKADPLTFAAVPLAGDHANYTRAVRSRAYRIDRKILAANCRR